MATYPSAIDSDATLPRVDDNITEIGGEAINALRDAIFAIEKELGLNISSPGGTLSDRLNASLDGSGAIKPSALIAAGLIALPITNNQISPSAGIDESKLNLVHTTTDLYTLINGALVQINNLNSLFSTFSSDLNAHVTGASTLQNGKPARHVGTQIDLNAVPSDPRDPFFVWSGLKDKNGNLRTATQVTSALLQINNDLISHENGTSNEHIAQAISVNTSNFVQLPSTANNVQLALEAIDNSESLIIEPHRATQHANGIPLTARSDFFINPDGYYVTVVPFTKVETYLSHPPLQTTPQDNILTGDDVIKFIPDSPTSGFIFDSQFSQVKTGDIITVNYGNGISIRHAVESVRDIIGNNWTVRINGTNLFDAQDGYILDGYSPRDGYVYAKIERPKFDTDIQAALAVAHANPNLATTTTWISSLIVVDPKAASVVGIGFDPNKLDSNHYKLYLQLFPDGNPANKVIDLSATILGIDVTGNQGTTPGKYTIDSIVAATNAGFRSAGFNYRFVAFNYKGEFGLALSDSINGCSFAIIDNSGPGTNNVIDYSTANYIDGLGLGKYKANVAGPVYSSSYATVNDAQFPTKVISPKRNRNYLVDGVSLDRFAPTPMANKNGYWPATIKSRINTGLSIEVSYSVPLDLRNSGLRVGKTITIQPAIPFNNSNYNDMDYGRFIIKSINFTNACNPGAEETVITVINGIHGTGIPVAFSSSPINLNVQMYFGYDSVSFDEENIINQIPSGDSYHRLHEIYVDRTGKTFSHEVLRMKVQSETSNLLDTTDTSSNISKFYLPNGWNIIDVSPKLRGYYDPSSPNKNKYLRLFILNYNTITGEFDGYIGQRDIALPTIYNVGPITKTRKNTIARFYDESNIDYIDLQFIETSDNSVIPTSILSTASPRYVDIELFPSLQLNDEYLLLSKCHTMASSDLSGVNGTFIKSVGQFREFGTLSEKDFTTSAINFIESGDRYLHNNGVIRGFEFKSSINSPVGMLYFKGGLALVDGHVSAVNDTSIEIPQIAPSATLPQTVNWAICVNKNNQLEAIILTNTKAQFFTLNKTPNYYVPSVTFSELLTTRKDLTPIYIVPVTIASITIGTPIDVRKFISNQDIAAEFVYSEEPGYGSNFASFNAMINWINQFGNVSNKIKLRGTFNITSSIDLSSLNNEIILEGDGNTIFNIKTSDDKGILFGSNISFKNITFNYDLNNPTTYPNTDKINPSAGCLFSNNSIIRNVKIENCKFNTSIFSDIANLRSRPPFISINTDGGLVENVSIIDGYYNDNYTGLTYGNGLCAAISIYNSSNSKSATLSDIEIKNNNCAQNQIIYIGAASAYPANIIINSIIEKNNCGIIGYLSTAYLTDISSQILFKQRPLGLTISKNTCHVITSLDESGKVLNVTKSISDPFGNTIIENNYVNYIAVYNPSSSTQYSKCSLIIQNNILNAYDRQDPSGYMSNFSGAINNAAINVRNTVGDSSHPPISCKIIGNQIKGNFYNSTNYYYMNGIGIYNTGSIISENEIYGLANDVGDSTGIFISVDSSTTPNASSVLVSENQIFKNNSNIYAYISGDGSVSPSSAVSVKIVDNYFDSYTVDGTDEDVLKNIYSSWIAERNINQTVTTFIIPSAGHHIRALNGVLFAPFTIGELTGKDIVFPTASSADSLIQVEYDLTYLTSNANIIVYYKHPVSIAPPQPTDVYNWQIPLNTILPENVKIVYVESNAVSSTAITAVGEIATMSLQIADENTNYIVGNPIVSFNDTLNKQIIINNPGLIVNKSNPVIRVLCSFLSLSSGLYITISPIIIKYRW